MLNRCHICQSNQIGFKVRFEKMEAKCLICGLKISRSTATWKPMPTLETLWNRLNGEPKTGFEGLAEKYKGTEYKSLIGGKSVNAGNNFEECLSCGAKPVIKWEQNLGIIGARCKCKGIVGGTFVDLLAKWVRANVPKTAPRKKSNCPKCGKEPTFECRAGHGVYVLKCRDCHLSVSDSEYSTVVSQWNELVVIYLQEKSADTWRLWSGKG